MDSCPGTWRPFIKIRTIAGEVEYVRVVEVEEEAYDRTRIMTDQGRWFQLYGSLEFIVLEINKAERAVQVMPEVGLCYPADMPKEPYGG